MYGNREMTVSICGGEYKLFLQDGFYNRRYISNTLHHHKYAEVHLILGGDIRYRLGDGQYLATDGCMLVIPPGVFHSGEKLGEEALCAAFQIDAEVAEFAAFPIGRALIGELFSEIDRAEATGDHSGIAAFAALLSRHFLPQDGLAAERITDYGFLIHEFFSHRYAEDVSLSDLAAELHLSERQTERLVAKHTGGSFRDGLSGARVRVAAQLLSESDMSLGEISAYVGYRSYAGFWKAMRKHGII